MFFHVLILKCIICIFCPLFFTLPNGVYRTRPYALFVFKMLWGLFIRMRLTYDDSFISLLKAAILSDVWNAELIHESLSKNCPSVNTYSLKRCLLKMLFLYSFFTNTKIIICFLKSCNKPCFTAQNTFLCAKVLKPQNSATWSAQSAQNTTEPASLALSSKSITNYFAIIILITKSSLCLPTI